MDEVNENKFIENLVKNFARSPGQVNSLQESDAELIEIPDSDLVLAITIDSIVEEIETGLYDDPYLIGWMTVMASMSDLAAVGAQPAGILISHTIPVNITNEYLNSLQKGIKDACHECHVYLIGGDTNYSSSLQMSGCGFGFVNSDSLLTRIGCSDGDHLFTTGFFGLGNAYAFTKLIESDKNKTGEISYLPKAKLNEGKLINEYASCCMDTSDGFISTIDQLIRLNNLGFIIEPGIDELIHPDALKLVRFNHLPDWIMLAGPHGEFELLYTIPHHSVNSFISAAGKIKWNPKRLGTVTNEIGLFISKQRTYHRIETDKIRNLYDEVNGNKKKYISQLLIFDNQWP
jgi:thiamine-monophosphate kinase